MVDNVQPVRDNQQIRCMGLKSVGDQKKQRNLANKLPGQKGQKKKQSASGGQEMNVQDSPPQADEDATPFEKDGKDKDELSKNGCGSILDLEI